MRVDVLELKSADKQCVHEKASPLSAPVRHATIRHKALRLRVNL